MFLRTYTRVQVWHAELRDRLMDEDVAFMGRQTNSRFESFKLP
jgi:hypothetical protein